MRTIRAFLPVLLVWLLWLAAPVCAQIAGFTGADDDGDGLPDDFEQAILQKFQPIWKLSAVDCDVLPAEFEPYLLTPTVRDRNGTIYGQVFFRGSSSSGFFVEAHFYDLWAADCGFLNSHPLDAEHVSALIRATDSSQPLSEWRATHWYFAAHEGTPCESSKTVSAGDLNAEDNGATVWVSWGKHAAFSQRRACNTRGGCGQDRCDDPILTHTVIPVNLGEPNAPLNGAVWTSSDQWPLLEKMDTDFSDKLLDPGKGPSRR
ncbi:MAG: hypothetical protein HY652_03815 [Acidobacteria bacterium]|nr:hypothetical protein [Acidobacteriota bacterium]